MDEVREGARQRLLFVDIVERKRKPAPIQNLYLAPSRFLRSQTLSRELQPLSNFDAPAKVSHPHMCR